MSDRDDARASAIRVARDVEPLRRSPWSWKPTSAKSSALTRNTRISQNALPESRVCTFVSSRRVPAHVDADRHRGEDARDTERRRGQVREVAGEQRDRHFRRRVVDPPPHLPHHERDDETDGDPADHVQDEVPRRVPERERSGDRRGDGGLVEHERETVVDEALALEIETTRRGSVDAPGDSVAASASVGETIAPSMNAPAHDRSTNVACATRRRRTSSLTTSPNASSEIGRRLRAQVAQAGEERCRVEERRQDRDEHEIRRQLEVRQPGYESEQRARRRRAGPARQPRASPRGRAARRARAAAGRVKARRGR